MRLRMVFWLVPAAFLAWGVLHAQRPFKEYPGAEYENFPLPPEAEMAKLRVFLQA